MFANKDLSKELFELSGWVPTKHGLEIDEDGEELTPEYSLGYLLRKLPKPSDIKISQGEENLIISIHCHQSRVAQFNTVTTRVKGPSYEDCVAMLAIELIKQGILTKKGRNNGNSK